MEDFPSNCTCFHLRRAARRATQIYDHELAAVDLSLNEYSILRRALQPRPLGTLADMLGMDRTTLTRNIRPLLDADWLEQRRDDHDARQKLIVATASGKRLLIRAKPYWQRAQDRIHQLFGEKQTLLLHSALKRLDQAIAGQAPRA